MGSEKLKYYEVDIMDIVPQQHYLSKEKMKKTVESFLEYDGYGDIYVIKYKDKLFSIDGHHRLFYLYRNGYKKVRVINELEDNDHELYQILADEAIDLGLKTIGDLEDRIIDNDLFEDKWIGKCQSILKDLRGKDVELISLTEDYEQQFKDFIQEFNDNNERLPGNAFEEGMTFNDLLKLLNNYENDICEKPHYVGFHTYYLLRKSDNKILGSIDIRHSLTDHLLEFGGHIGYGIRKSERQLGYATIMLKLALEKCKELNLDKVLITCDKNNIGSAKTIINNGGILENEINHDTRITQRYWINI